MSSLTNNLAKLAKESMKKCNQRQKNASPALNRITDPQTPSSPLAPMNLSLNNIEYESTSAEAIVGCLTRTLYCTAPAMLARVFGAIVSTTFKYPTDEESALQTQFDTYFGMLGWSSEFYNCLVRYDTFHAVRYDTFHTRRPH